MLSIDFDDGMIATVLLSFNAPGLPHERFIVGAAGTIHLEAETYLRVNDQVAVDGKEKGSSFYRQLDGFVAAMHEHRSSLASGEEVRGVIGVPDAARVSIRESRVVAL